MWIDIHSAVVWRVAAAGEHAQVAVRSMGHAGDGGIALVLGRASVLTQRRRDCSVVHAMRAVLGVKQAFWVGHVA